MRSLYRRINGYIFDLVEYPCEQESNKLLLDARERLIIERLKESSVIADIEKIYNAGIAKIDRKWSKYGYTDRLTVADIIARRSVS